MTIARKTKAKIKMIEMGIVPAFTGHELSTMLKSLSEEEGRKAKRKFRKQWRKMLKEDPSLSYLLIPDNESEPDKNHLRNRACMIVSSIIRDIDS